VLSKICIGSGAIPIANIDPASYGALFGNNDTLNANALTR
jgi:cellobiose-specific phosphotransferase system component IIB